MNGLILREAYTQGHKLEAEKLLSYYLDNCSLSNDEADALLKLNIAKGLLDYESLKSGEFVSLPQHKQKFEDKKRFLQGIADEIVSKSQRVELLVQHNVSKGNYREMLVRSILKQYIPKRYDVVTGFIEGCKRQCDIIIYDAHNFSPFFQEGDLVVVPEKSVRAVIEVKSTLGSNELNEALDLLSEVAKNRNFPAPFFKAIFSFKKGYNTPESLAEAVFNFYHKKDAETGFENNISYLNETVNSICVLNEQCIVTDLIDYKHKDLSIRPRLYSVDSDVDDLKVYCATFFSELFSYLDVEKHAKKINISYFGELDYDIRYKMIKELYEPDWKPSTTFKGEHHWDLTSLWKRVSDVMNWKAGTYTIQDLEQQYFSEDYKLKNYHERSQNASFIQPTFNSKK